MNWVALLFIALMRLILLSLIVVVRIRIIGEYGQRVHPLTRPEVTGNAIILIYSETSHTDHLYRSTTCLYRPAFRITEIKSAVSFLCRGKFYKSTTSLNGPHEFTTASDRFREVLL